MPNQNETLADSLLKGHERTFTVRADFGEGMKTYPVWKVMEALLWLVDKNGCKVRFHLNYPQVLLYLDMCEAKEGGKPVREDVLKARQLGYSTFIAGFGFIVTMFTPNFKMAVMADTESHAHNIFAKYSYFYEHLDDSNPYADEIREFEERNKGKRHFRSYKPELKYAKGMEYMETRQGNSLLQVVVAGQSSGRSGNYNFLHCSECAFFSNLKVTLNGALETVSDTAMNSFIFLETTANGFNEYKDRWDRDQSGKSIWRAFFMPWFKNPDYSRKLRQFEDFPRMDEWLIAKQRMFGISDEQMLWYWDKFQGKGDKMLTLQEYPFSPVDAFVSSGDCVFDADLLAKRKEEIVARMSDKDNPIIKRRGIFAYRAEGSPDMKTIELHGIRFVDGDWGPLRVFEEPKPGHPYVLNCDPNNETNDDSAIQVLDNSTGRQVACFSSNRYEWDAVAYQIYCIGRHYNWALVSNEMNVGKTVMDYLLKLHYPKLYLNKDLEVDNYMMSAKRRFGHILTKANRPYLISALRIAFRDDPKMVSDYETICQMESFQRVAHTSRSGVVTKKDEAVAGAHDDLVTSLMGCLLIRDQQTYAVTATETKATSGLSIKQLEEIIEARRRNSSDKPQSAFEMETGIVI